MYYSLDGILTWGEVVRVSCADSRRPWVPLHGVPKRPGYPNLALCSVLYVIETNSIKSNSGISQNNLLDKQG